MASRNTVVVFAALAAVAAWAADVVVAPTVADVPPSAFDAGDGPLELKYDNNTRSFFFCDLTGRGRWVGNDFDLSAISDYRAIMKIKVYSWPDWPNGKWDGFRLGIYGYAGGQPTSLLWGPKYYKPTRTGYGWCTCSVGWTLPPENKIFVAGVEQYYDYPDLDPMTLDSNLTFAGHSWLYESGSWSKLPGVIGYRNLMLRVVVNNVPVDITPTSVGRVKALYY
ncbi:MAG TPA: hypothetical protein VMX79_09750 [bacterium]|nr:hypothetical protein [bacterium]